MSEKSTNKDTGAGKGDKPRNCFSQTYRDNYDSINWCNNKNDKKDQGDVNSTNSAPKCMRTS